MSLPQLGDKALGNKNPAIADGVNVLSGDGSAQSNRPAFPLRVLYSFQPRVLGIRLPDKGLAANGV